MRYQCYSNIIVLTSFFHSDPLRTLLGGAVSTCDMIYIIGDHGYCLYPSSILSSKCAHVLGIEWSEQSVSKVASYVGSALCLLSTGCLPFDLKYGSWRWFGDSSSKVVSMFQDSGERFFPGPGICWKVVNSGVRVKVEN